MNKYNVSDKGGAEPGLAKLISTNRLRQGYGFVAQESLLLSEYGTCKTVKARFWPWLSDKSPLNVSSCSLLARKWHRDEGNVGEGQRHVHRHR